MVKSEQLLAHSGLHQPIALIMPWLGSKFYKGYWWDYDPDDGEVQKATVGNFVFVGYVSRGLDDVTKAADEYLDEATRPGFIPPATFRFYCFLRDDRHVFYDPGDGEYGIVEDNQAIKKGYNAYLRNAWVGKAKGYIASLLGPEHESDTVPLHGFRHIFSLADERQAFYDPGDGEWGIVNQNGWRVHRGYDYEKLFDVTASLAMEIVEELLKKYESGSSTDTETDTDRDAEETDSNSRRSTESENSTDENLETSIEDEEDSSDGDLHPDEYRLFRTVNFHGEKQALCYGLAYYWLRERLTTDYTLKQSMPDYDEAVELQDGIDERTGSTKSKYWQAIEADGLDHEYEIRKGVGAVEVALDLVCEKRGAYLVMFRPMNSPIVHCVGMWRGEDETGFFDPNMGVYKVPSDRALRNVFWSNLIAWKRIFREIDALRFYVIRIWDPANETDSNSSTDYTDSSSE